VSSEKDSVSAKRSAKALCDVALTEKADLSQIDRDMAAVADMFEGNRDLLTLATRSNVPPATRDTMVAALATKLGLGQHVTKMFALLAGKNALEITPAVAAAFRERLLDHQNIVHAEVTSATPLTPENAKALEDSLSKVTGKKVNVSLSVDPELLGGVVAKIGSTVFDGSVRTQLKSMRQQLVAEKA
jgi:F-type H+-transporting ATPase subunit delta